eukprot:UN14642
MISPDGRCRRHWDLNLDATSYLLQKRNTSVINALDYVRAFFIVFLS